MANDIQDALEVSTDETQVVETQDVNGDDKKDNDTQEVTESDESKVVPLKTHREELSKRNSEARSLRERLKSIEGKSSTLEAERDTLREERDNLRDRLQTYELERAVVEAAADPKVGARNPNKLVKLVDRSNLTFKEDGSIEGIDQELKRLKKEWSELFVDSRNAVDAGAGGQAVESFDMNELLRRGVRH